MPLTIVAFGGIFNNSASKNLSSDDSCPVTTEISTGYLSKGKEKKYPTESIIASISWIFKKNFQRNDANRLTWKRF